MRRRRILIIIASLMAFTLLIMSGCSPKHSETPAQVQKIPVTVEKIGIADMEKTITLGGLLQPQEEVFLSAKNPALRVLKNNVQVGDQVSPGEPLVVFDSRDLDLQLEQAQLNYERNKQLFEAGAVSLSQLEQLKFNLDNLLLQKENLVITSPIQGVVAQVSSVEGQLCGSAPLVSVVNIDRLKLQVQVGETNIGKLKIGAEMAVTVPSVNGEYTGTITALAPQIDSRTKAYPVTLEIVNKDNLIRGGMYGEVQLVLEHKEGVIAVPQNAILDQAQKKIVYIVENETAVEKEVRVGLTLGDKAEILEGLKEGEMLVVEGQYAVKDGIAVIASVRGEN